MRDWKLWNFKVQSFNRVPVTKGETQKLGSGWRLRPWSSRLVSTVVDHGRRQQIAAIDCGIGAVDRGIGVVDRGCWLLAVGCHRVSFSRGSWLLAEEGSWLRVVWLCAWLMSLFCVVSLFVCLWLWLCVCMWNAFSLGLVSFFFLLGNPIGYSDRVKFTWPDHIPIGFQWQPNPIQIWNFSSQVRLDILPTPTWKTISFFRNDALFPWRHDKSSAMDLNIVSIGSVCKIENVDVLKTRFFFCFFLFLGIRMKKWTPTQASLKNIIKENSNLLKLWRLVKTS